MVRSSVPESQRQVDEESRRQIDEEVLDCEQVIYVLLYGFLLSVAFILSLLVMYFRYK